MPSYEEYCKTIKPLWDSHWLTNMGKYHMELEDALKKYLDVPDISLMVNGHMALELAIQAFDFASSHILRPFFLCLRNAGRHRSSGVFQFY